MARRKSRLELITLNRIICAGFDHPILEFKFHPKRKWRFDFVLIMNLGVEDKCSSYVNADNQTMGLVAISTPTCTECARINQCKRIRKIAIESEGGTWIGGRHTRGVGFANDAEKYNEAAALGWIVLRYTMKSIDRIINDLRRICDQK